MKLPGISLLRFGEGEDYSPIAALRSLLRFQGVDVTYPTLMALSGAAFRHAWSPLAYHPRALLASPEPLLPPVIEALGMVAKPLELTRADGAWAPITERIATGHPVLFWGGSKWRSAGLLFGYDDWPSALWVRSVTDATDAGRALSFTAWKQLCTEGVEAWAFEPGTGRRTHDTFAILKRAVRTMLAEPAADSVYGLDAYESWADTVERMPPLPGSLEATICLAAARTLVDARHAAEKWLTELPLPLPSSLVRAIDCYTDFRFLMNELALAFRHARGAGDAPRLAKLIRAAGKEDAKALSAIRATISIVAL